MLESLVYKNLVESMERKKNLKQVDFCFVLGGIILCSSKEGVQNQSECSINYLIKFLGKMGIF